jgi:twitching motility protein PilJ
MTELNVSSINPTSSKKQSYSFLQWYYNLPIRSKQITRLYTSQIISIFGLVGLSSMLIVTAGRTQLLHQAKAELAVTEINYNIKINQMGYGFRGQSDNIAIVNGAISYATNKPLTPQLTQQIKNIFQNEIKARNIEYATLVGRDRRIIVNANANRSGEIFDPNNLVSEVFKNSQQIKSTSIVSKDELRKESVPLTQASLKQDALIRYTVTPIKNTPNGLVIGAIISGDVVNKKLPIVEETLKIFGSGYSGVYLWTNQEFILATSLDDNKEDQSKPAAVNKPVYDTRLLKEAVENPQQIVTMRASLPGKNTTYTLAAKALVNWQGKPIGVLVRGTTETSLNELLRNSLLLQLGIASLALIAEVLLVNLLGQTIAQPIKKLQQTTQQFTKGNRQVRAEPLHQDELGELAQTFNQMADSIIVSEDTLAKQNDRQQASAERLMLLANFTNYIYQSLNIQVIISTSLTEIRKVLAVDRVEIYYFNEDNQSGLISAESVKPGFSKMIGQIKPMLFFTEEIEQYKKGITLVFNNIKQANFTKERRLVLEHLKINASLVAPILQNGELVALLSAHQCDKIRNWQHEEINLITQLAAQIGFALNQASLVQQLEKARQETKLAHQKADAISAQVEQAHKVSAGNYFEQHQQKEAQQRQIFELLNYIETTATGDLTVRAQVNKTELGTVSDFFNLLVEQLQELVLQVKYPSIQVKTALESHGWAVGQLSEQLRQQALEINRTLDSVEQMTQSIQAVAKKASLAETVACTAARAASVVGESMNSTVEEIVNLQTTVVKTTDQVKLLGESSKQLAKVMSWVQQIGLQTHLLAINAGIEANRSGEGGGGFRVIAEQVSILASQSTSAIQEIEQVITTMQVGTKEVVAAMEEGTRKVILTTRSVIGVHENLTPIFEVSRQIDQLVTEITSDTISQAQISSAVTDSIKKISKSAQEMDNSSSQVSHSIRNTLLIAEQLQQSIGQFKLETETGT